MNTGLLVTVAVVTYGALSLIAAAGGLAADGPQGQLALFAIAGMALIAFPWVPYKLPLLLVGLVGLHVAAIWQGIAQDEFHASHHVIRALVSIVILGLFVRSQISADTQM